MSARAWCPACDSETSNIRAGFRDRGECPHCGLSAAAAEELTAAMRRGADRELVERTARAEMRAQASERTATVLRRALDQAREVLSEAVREATP